MIIEATEKIFCYEVPEANIEQIIKNRYTIVAMDADLKNTIDSQLKFGEYCPIEGKEIEKYEVQFLRNDNIDTIRMGGRISFPTIRGMKSIHTVGKNDLVKSYDGTLVLCKRKEITTKGKWFYISSNIPAVICVNGIFVEI